MPFMKMSSSLRAIAMTLAAVLTVLLIPAVPTMAADPPIPIVHILATDPCAAEANSEPARFLVVRDGPTNGPLTVAYGVTGSAQNGIDYQTLPGTVVIPPGARHAPIVVRPIDDSLVEGDETILIVLIQPL